ncbi:MAG: lipid II flippase MurJ, partial [Chlamydiota bacterium]
ICTFGIFALGGVGVNFLFGHGDFNAESVKETVYCLWGYGLGLLPAVFTLLLAAGFYAQKSYRTPTTASLISVAINICLNAFFVFVLGWGAVSIAIATSLSAFFNAGYLTFGLKQKVGEIFTAQFWVFFLKMTVCCAIPAALTIFISHIWMKGEFPRSFQTQVLQLGVLTSIYVSGLGILAWAFRLEILLELVRRNKPRSEDRGLIL